MGFNISRKYQRYLMRINGEFKTPKYNRKASKKKQREADQDAKPKRSFKKQIKKLFTKNKNGE